LVRKWSRRVAYPREDDVQPDPELLQDVRSLREGLWRMAQDAHEALQVMDRRIEAEDLDGEAEAGELRRALERMQSLSLELSEELDAYQQRYAS
jgi:hypothetical protein